MRCRRAERRARLASAIVALALAAALAADDGAQDRLEGARLFFGAAERARADRSASAHASAEGEISAPARDARAEARSARAAVIELADDGLSGEAPASPGAATAAAPARFEARLRVGRRWRVVIDGHPCRGAATPDRAEVARLHCRSLPRGVEALHLDADGELLATFAGGGRRPIALGEAFRR